MYNFQVSLLFQILPLFFMQNSKKQPFIDTHKHIFIYFLFITVFQKFSGNTVLGFQQRSKLDSLFAQFFSTSELYKKHVKQPEPVQQHVERFQHLYNFQVLSHSCYWFSSSRHSQNHTLLIPNFYVGGFYTAFPWFWIIQDKSLEIIKYGFISIYWMFKKKKRLYVSFSSFISLLLLVFNATAIQ